MGGERATGRVLLSSERAQQIAFGSLWVYESDVAKVEGEPGPGDLVDLYSRADRFCGRGFYNPHSKIRVRFLTFRDEPITESFWTRRLEGAAALRALVVSGTNAYRLVHGESDLLPGLIVDRYGEVLVMQVLSFGMERRKDLLAELLKGLTGASAVYLRNDAHARAQEGLPLGQGFLMGEGPTKLEIHEGRARFFADIEQGQKTGWFCDQRENRLAAAALAPGSSVLEAFCHTGAFGIQAALHGAESVLGLDVSAQALAMAREHAALNKVEGRCQYREADAFQELRKLERTGRRYGLVVLDPPAFARSRQTVAQALAGYKEINRLALRLVRPEGFLVTCSCSHHVSEPALWKTILEAARDARRRLRLLEARSQARDHPVLASMPETRYLKCFILQAL
ncbi:MAG: class I SAM-dependent rRNA methyltransferase [Nitrospirota bacterium]